jgi:hypothetical protein
MDTQEEYIKTLEERISFLEEELERFASGNAKDSVSTWIIYDAVTDKYYGKSSWTSKKNLAKTYGNPGHAKTTLKNMCVGSVEKRIINGKSEYCKSTERIKYYEVIELTAVEIARHKATDFIGAPHGYYKA